MDKGDPRNVYQELRYSRCLIKVGQEWVIDVGRIDTIRHASYAGIYLDSTTNSISDRKVFEVLVHKDTEIPINLTRRRLVVDQAWSSTL